MKDKEKEKEESQAEVQGADLHVVIGYLEELEDRLPRYARRAKAIKPEDQYSVEWFAELGNSAAMHVSREI